MKRPSSFSSILGLYVSRTILRHFSARILNKYGENTQLWRTPRLIRNPMESVPATHLGILFSVKYRHQADTMSRESYLQHDYSELLVWVRVKRFLKIHEVYIKEWFLMLFAWGLSKIRPGPLYLPPPSKTCLLHCNFCHCFCSCPFQNYPEQTLARMWH